ncbi:MAG: iron ABC transporter permease [Peptococcaceae bacterium]|nr:iron ABC transporter permease [Peptococcaceae bacterium]
MDKPVKRGQGFLLKTFYALIAVTIIYFIVLPIISVFYYGITSGSEAELSGKILPRVWKHMGNSLKVAIFVTFVSTSFGLLASITLWRMKFWGRKIMRILVLMPLISPPFVGSVAFIMLFGKRGLITYTLLGFEVSPFGYHGIVTMQSIGLATLAYLIISSAIKKTDVSYEEAARSLGAPEGKIFRTITLPLMIPEITVAAMLVFLVSMADFSTPIIIGGAFQTLASDLYIQITGLYNMKTASISGMFLFVP